MQTGLAFVGLRVCLGRRYSRLQITCKYEHWFERVCPTEVVFMPQRISIAQAGPAEVMQLQSYEPGEPGAGQVRIRQHAVGVNYIDVYQRSGVYPLPMPLALGMEAAGVVDAVGEGVVHLRAGDRVAYASQPPGAYCDLRVLPAMCVCKLPDAISFDVGAAMMLKGLTVQYLLRNTLPQGGLHAGDFVLWHAAAGGVGLMACQWAKAMGLQLIGTASTDAKCELARQHGAAHTVNYSNGDWAAQVREITGGKGVKVVYDAVGASTWDGSLSCLQPFGLMVSFGNASGKVPPIDIGSLGAKGSLYVTRPTLFSHITSRENTQAMFDDLAHMVASGAVKVVVERRYALADATQAHRDLQARITTGASVLLPEIK
jgi:NADPH:quinone reductase